MTKIEDLKRSLNVNGPVPSAPPVTSIVPTPPLLVHEVDDDDVIQRFLNRSAGARAVFGDGVTPLELWNADPEALGLRWPDQSGMRPYDESSADASLASRIAFEIGNDPIRIERIMRRSALYRDKWDNRPDYLARTIQKACDRSEAAQRLGESQRRLMRRMTA